MENDYEESMNDDLESFLINLQEQEDIRLLKMIIYQ